jgi:hypothetical protein
MMTANDINNLSRAFGSDRRARACRVVPALDSIRLGAHRAVRLHTLRRRLQAAEVDVLRPRKRWSTNRTGARASRALPAARPDARPGVLPRTTGCVRRAARAVEGLEVARGAAATRCASAGFGFTQAGEIVSLGRQIEVSLADMPALQLVNARLRLDLLKRPPLRNRTGVFVLALRPLEFTANPIAAYPSGLDRERTVEAGDVVEAASLALYPLADAAPTTTDTVRAQLARAAFVDRNLPAIPPEILPLAVVALTGDNVRWIDVHLVRRQAGQAHSDVLGFGFAPRLLREAHLAHYRARLDELAGRSFAATQFFEALPPAGPLPATAVNAQDFSQMFFPAGVNAELSIIPDDELAALVEESMTLPPIDLTEPAIALNAVFVSLLIPVPRVQVRALAARLSGSVVRLPRPTLTTLTAKRLPIDTLRLITSPFDVRPSFDPNALIDNAWRAALEAARGGEGLWYARRRNLAYNESIAGRTVNVTTPDADLEGRVNDRMRDLGLLTRWREVNNRADVSRAELTRLMACRRSRRRWRTPRSRSERQGGRSRRVAEVAATVAQPGVGEGLAKLAEVKPELLNDRTTIKKLVDSGAVVALDRHLSSVGSAEVTRVAGALETEAGGRTIDVRPSGARR